MGVIQFRDYGESEKGCEEVASKLTEYSRRQDTIFVNIFEIVQNG